MVKPNLRPAVAAAACLLWVATANAQTVVKPGFNIFSVAQDQQIGAQSAAQADRQIPLVSDASSATRYVAAIGNRLVPYAPGPRFPYRFRVVNQSDVNAFALPGGYVYVNRGLIENVRSEGELAGVIAHEIAHVGLRHPTSQASKAYLAQAGIGLLGGLLGGRQQGSTNQIVSALGGFGLNSLFLKFSRTLESQADIAGAQIMARAGYDPNEMATFFSRMSRAPGGNPGQVATFLSNHPAPANREARVRQESALLTYRAARPIGSLAVVQSQLRGLGPVPLASQAGQASPGGAAPVPASASFRLFHQSDGMFDIGVPGNWSAYSNTGYGVTFAPRGGIVSVGGRQVVATGMIVNHYVPFDGSVEAGHVGVNLAAATNDLVDRIEQTNPHLRRVSGSARSGPVSGRRIYMIGLAGVSPATQAEERVTVAATQAPDGHVIYALMIAPEADYSTLAPTFDRMLGSLRVSETATHE